MVIGTKDLSDEFAKIQLGCTRQAYARRKDIFSAEHLCHLRDVVFHFRVREVGKHRTRKAAAVPAHRAGPDDALGNMLRQGYRLVGSSGI